MIEVEVDKILPLNNLKTETDKIAQDIQNPEHPENLYVFVNEQAKPIAALINIDYLKKLTGKEKIPVKKPAETPSSPISPVINPMPSAETLMNPTPSATPLDRPFTPAPSTPMDKPIG